MYVAMVICLFPILHPFGNLYMICEESCCSPSLPCAYLRYFS